MGHVLVWHLDGRLPNLALMRLAAHHCALGDTVELRRGSPYRLLWDGPARAHGPPLHPLASPGRAAPRALPGRAPGAERGTGCHDHAGPRGDSGGGTPRLYPYSGHPYSLGFTQAALLPALSLLRGTPEEGRVQPVATVAEDRVRAPRPRNLLLLDNDFFGQAHWTQRLEEFRTGQFRVCFTQGINVRLLTEDAGTGPRQCAVHGRPVPPPAPGYRLGKSPE